MPVCKWIHTLFSGAKGHLTCTSLVPFVVHDIVQRGYPVSSPGKILKKAHFDRGTSCFVDRPHLSFCLEGLDLTFPCEEIAFWLTSVRSLPLRTFDPMPRGKVRPQYYKLKAAYHCLVLTVRQKNRLEKVFQDRLVESENKSFVFYAERNTPGEILAQSPLIVVEGPDPVARFRPHVRGEA